MLSARRSRRLPRGAVIAVVAAFLGTMLVASPAFATAPTITSFAPSAAPTGTAITINGTTLTGATAVRFNGVPSGFTVNSATKITATVPQSASTGKITVTTPGGTATSAATFTVQPSINLSASSGPPGVAITVTGAGFSPSATVYLYIEGAFANLTGTNATGNFGPTTFVIPSVAPYGQYAINASELVTGRFATKPFLVSTEWAMSGFQASSRFFNPFENIINHNTVANLTHAWSAPVSNVSNPIVMAESGGIIFTGDLGGIVHAFSHAGKLLWTATTGENLSQTSPAVFGGHVFFAGLAGDVKSYVTTCRSDGGLCTASWTTHVAPSVSGGLTVNQGTLYAPGNDGFVHPINPSTGAPGAAFVASDSAHGAISTAVTFSPDGTFYYGTNNFLQYRAPTGSTTIVNFSSFVATPAVSNQLVYVDAANGVLTELGGASWAAALSGGAGCDLPPAVAYNTVFAAACNSVQAFDAGTGAVKWSVALSVIPLGMVVAGNTVYVCDGFAGLMAFDAGSGARLWSAGPCSTQPIVANNTVYANYQSLNAYDLAPTSP